MSDDSDDILVNDQPNRPDRPEALVHEGHTAQFVNWAPWSVAAPVVAAGLFAGATTPYPINAIGAIIAVLAVLWGTYRYYAAVCDSFTLSSQRLTTQYGVFHRRTDMLELYRVKDAVVDEPLIHRLVGIGNVTIFTSDRSNPELKLSAIAEPHEVAQLIREYTEYARDSKHVREVD